MKSDRIKNWPKEERPRERLIAEGGADKLTEAELLAIVLRVGQGTFKEGVRYDQLLGLDFLPIAGTIVYLVGVVFARPWAGTRTLTRDTVHRKAAPRTM